MVSSTSDRVFPCYTFLIAQYLPAFVDIAKNIKDAPRMFLFVYRMQG